jgi:hypothetical protein
MVLLILGEFAHINSDDNKGLFVELLYLRVFKKMLVHFAWATP